MFCNYKHLDCCTVGDLYRINGGEYIVLVSVKQIRRIVGDNSAIIFRISP